MANLLKHTRVKRMFISEFMDLSYNNYLLLYGILTRSLANGRTTLRLKKSSLTLISSLAPLK